MTKKNIRSIRYSDEMAELIDRQIGDTFTEKFENLVIRCVWELPQKEAELEELEKQIREKREELEKIYKTTAEWRQTMQNITSRLWALEAALKKETEIKGL